MYLARLILPLSMSQGVLPLPRDAAYHSPVPASALAPVPALAPAPDPGPSPAYVPAPASGMLSLPQGCCLPKDAACLSPAPSPCSCPCLGMLLALAPAPAQGCSLSLPAEGKGPFQGQAGIVQCVGLGPCTIPDIQCWDASCTVQRLCSELGPCTVFVPQAHAQPVADPTASTDRATRPCTARAWGHC